MSCACRDLLAQVKCDLVPESGIRMRETYKSARFYVQEAELVRR